MKVDTGERVPRLTEEAVPGMGEERLHMLPCWSGSVSFLVSVVNLLALVNILAAIFKKAVMPFKGEDPCDIVLYNNKLRTDVIYIQFGFQLNTPEV